MHIIRSGQYMVQCHLTLFLPRKSVKKGTLFYIWVDWCQCHSKTKGTLRIDAQKFVKQVLGRSFWIEA